MRPESTLTELNAESNRQFKKLELERLRGTQGRAGEDAVVDTELRPLLNIHRFDPEEQETCQIGLHYSAEGRPYVGGNPRIVPVEIIQRKRKNRIFKRPPPPPPHRPPQKKKNLHTPPNKK